MADDEIPLEEFWNEIRKFPIEIQSPKLQEQLEIICKETATELAEKCQEFIRKPLDAETLAFITAQGIGIFFEKWHEGIKSQNLAGLIEIVLEGQDLTPEDLQGFIRALPLSLLEQVTQSVIGSASGTHALLAFEWHYRKGTIRGFEIFRNTEGKVAVKVITPKEQEIVFPIEEKFDFENLDGGSEV